MANGIEAYIFTLVLTTLVVLVGTVGRFWILRDRPRTFAVNLSDSAVISFCLAMVFLAGLGFDVVNSELVERVYGSEDPRSRSLNIKSLKEFFAMSIICTVQVWLLKAAFLGYYWSLRETLSGKVRMLLYTVSAYTAVTFVGVTILQFCYCRPLSLNWSDGPDRCITVQTVPGMIVQHGSNISSDILILIIPMLTIGSFRANYGLGRKELYAIAFVFCVGVMSIMASVVRFVQVYHVVIGTDTSIVAVRQTLIWVLIEKLFAFIAFFLPCLRVYFRKRYSGEYAIEKGSGRFTGSFTSSI